MQLLYHCCDWWPNERRSLPHQGLLMKYVCIACQSVWNDGSDSLSWTAIICVDVHVLYDHDFLSEIRAVISYFTKTYLSILVGVKALLFNVDISMVGDAVLPNSSAADSQRCYPLHGPNLQMRAVQLFDVGHRSSTCLVCGELWLRTRVTNIITNHVSYMQACR